MTGDGTPDGAASFDRPAGSVPMPPTRQTPVYRWLSGMLRRLEMWLRSHGGTGLRRTIQVFWAVLAGIGVLLLVGPVINEPLSFEDITSSADDATETWIARSFDADYTLERNADGRLETTVVETIEVLFTDETSESTVERVIATQYEGHDLALELTAASLDGEQVEAEVRRGPTQTTIVIDAGERLTGDHRVSLRYTLHDVAYVGTDRSSQRPQQILQWDVFGPDWSHAVAETAVRITVPQELAASYDRQPSGGVAWLLLSDSTTLTVDEATDDAVVYTLDNDQNLPPHASFWFTFRFAPDTFTMPPPSFVFWVHVVGPFVPLALLAISLLLSVAARRVAWADARGREWFVPESAPRKEGTPPLDARLARAVRVAPLVDALTAYRTHRDARRTRALVRAARRTGRLGDLPGAWSRYLGAPAWREQFALGLRRVPKGFVRDAFLGGTIAWTLVQWGLVRQLSHQVVLSEYWWPLAVVAVTTLLAVAVLAVTLSARPLTRAGALAAEHLRGQRLHLSQTLAAERITAKDRDLPYVLMFQPPRQARRLMLRLLDQAGVTEKVFADPDFVTGGRLAVRVGAVLLAAALIVVAFTVPASTRHDPDHFEILEDVEGDYGVYVSDIDIDATLRTAADGRAQLDVVETLTADVDSNLRAIPQITRVWRDRVDGHDMQLTVTGMTVDGAEVPFDQDRLKGYAFAQSRVFDEWPGEHTLTVSYTLADAAAAAQVDGQWRDQVRWTALLPWWTTTWEGVDHEPEHLRVALAVEDGLDQQLIGASGWIDDLPNRPERPVVPFEDPRHPTLDAVPDDEDWPSASAYVGTQLQFAAGTFAGPSQQEWLGAAAVASLPIVLPVGAAVISLLCALAAWTAGRRLRGVARDLVRWLPPLLAVAQFPLLGWTTGDMYDDDPVLPVALLSAGLTVAAAVVVLIKTRRRGR